MLQHSSVLMEHEEDHLPLRNLNNTTSEEKSVNLATVISFSIGIMTSQKLFVPWLIPELVKAL